MLFVIVRNWNAVVALNKGFAGNSGEIKIHKRLARYSNTAIGLRYYISVFSKPQSTMFQQHMIVWFIKFSFFESTSFMILLLYREFHYTEWEYLQNHSQIRRQETCSWSRRNHIIIMTFVCAYVLRVNTRLLYSVGTIVVRRYRQRMIIEG